MLLFALQLAPIALSAWSVAHVELPLPVRVALAALVYLVSQPLLAGVLSLPFRKSMIPGRFPRDLGHRVYAGRRLFGACWTAVYYNTFTYPMVLAMPPLKWVVFRLFGYRGCCAFTLYPDTWIRDLPLLTVGRGAYLSNKSTIAPNIATPDGALVVGRVDIGAGAMIGHGTMVAPGVSIGVQAVVGVGCGINTGAVLEERCTVGNMSGVDLGARIGKAATVGACNVIGARATIGPGIHTPTHLHVPRRRVLRTQAEVDDLAEGQGITHAVRRPAAYAIGAAHGE